MGRGVLIYNFNKNSPLFFTGGKLRPPGIGIEATGSNASARALN